MGKSKKTSQILYKEVAKLLAKNKNYLIEKSHKTRNSIRYCIIYFSSNNIYFPEEPEYLYEDLVKKNKYEWYHTRVDRGTKHIFVRDIKKQHYLSGVNSELNTLEKVCEFLKRETKGYKVITIGVSSGGYAAVFFGQKLNAEQIYCFNGQFLLELDSWRFADIEESTIQKYYSLKDIFMAPSTIFYFYSNRSSLDAIQFKSIKKTGVNIISISSRVHGIPFLKCCLPVLLNMNSSDLKKLAGRNYSPLFFSIKMVGIQDTLIGSYRELLALVRHGAHRRTMKNALTVWISRLTG